MECCSVTEVYTGEHMGTEVFGKKTLYDCKNNEIKQHSIRIQVTNAIY